MTVKKAASSVHLFLGLRYYPTMFFMILANFVAQYNIFAVFDQKHRKILSPKKTLAPLTQKSIWRASPMNVKKINETYGLRKTIKQFKEEHIVVSYAFMFIIFV